MGENLRHGVGAARMKGGILVLDDLAVLGEHFAGGSLIELRFWLDDPDGLRQVQAAQGQ